MKNGIDKPTGDAAAAIPPASTCESALLRRVKFKLHDKRVALVDLGRHLGLFVEKHKHDIHVDEVDISSVRDTILSALARLA